MTHPARLDSLTGLRWFAALSVFVFHVYLLLHLIPGMTLRGTFSGASAGVSFFFILSGFVLAWSHVPGRSAAAFWQDRFARIWPNHAVTWLAATLAFAPVAFRLATARTLVGAPSVVALIFGQAWIPGTRWNYAGNLVAWSLSCEVFFYLCFPVIIVVVSRARRPWALLAGAVSASVIVAVIGGSMSHATGQWWGYFFPPSRLPEFVGGVVLARLVREGRWPRLPLGPVVAAAVAVVFCDRWLPWNLLYAAGPLIPLGVVVATAATAELSGGARRLRHPRLIRLGELSFAFYLVHNIVLEVGLKWLHWRPGGGLRDVGLALAFLAVAMAGAWLLNVVVERPAQRLLRSRTRTQPLLPPRPDPVPLAPLEVTAPIRVIAGAGLSPGAPARRPRPLVARPVPSGGRPSPRRSAPAARWPHP